MMKKKKCGLRMVAYEWRNLNGNFMSHFFGIVFPNLMCLVLSKTIGGQMAEDMRIQINTSIMLSMAMVMPMAIMLLGYGAIYSLEVENGVPLRMRLFGFAESSLMTAKIAAHLLLLTISFVIFGAFQILVTGIRLPAVSSLLCLLACLYLVGIILLVISHSIANICRRFSVTFGIEMSLYFVMMVLTGMMGIKTEQLPKILQAVAATLPMTYIGRDFADFWQGGSYNFMPLIQSFLFFGALAGILLLVSQHMVGREKNDN